MSLLELLKKQNSSPSTLWRGSWARIWLKPSIFSGQRFIVGLAMIDENGLCDFRFISDTAKFECVYDDSVRVLVDEMLTLARTKLGEARHMQQVITTEMLPPGIHLEHVGFASGVTSLEALEIALSNAEIPMEIGAELSKARRFKSRSADEVTLAVINALKNKMGLNAEMILREDFFGTEAHSARVNLVLPSQAGIIASGWYASADRVVLELLRAVTTVEGYSASHNKSGIAGVFFLRPTIESGLRIDQGGLIENALDQVEWQLAEKRRLRVVIHESEHELAESIAEWAG
ncbi:MAG: hypothetical protein V4857_15200 [Pseudomonadota bacterium]